MHKNIQKFWIFQSISSSLIDVEDHIENPLAMEFESLLFTLDFELELAVIEQFCSMQQTKVANLHFCFQCEYASIDCFSAKYLSCLHHTRVCVANLYNLYIILALVIAGVSVDLISSSPSPTLFICPAEPVEEDQPQDQDSCSQQSALDDEAHNTHVTSSPRYEC